MEIVFVAGSARISITVSERDCDENSAPARWS